MPSTDEVRTIAERLGTRAFRETNGAGREQRLPARLGERQLVVSRMAEPLERQTIDEIAEMLRTLTYGEMIELAEGLWGARPPTDLSKDSLPGLLHRWAMSRKN